MSKDESKARSDQTDPDSQNQTDSSNSDSNIKNNADGDDYALEISGAGQFIMPPPNDSESQVSVLSGTLFHQHTHSGPLPSPATLQAYGEIDPSIPKIIVAQFENESAHRRHEEERKSAAFARDIHAGRMEGRIGQILGVLVLLVMLGVIWSLAIADHAGVAIALAGSLAIVITVFVTGKYRREQEHTENEDDNG